MKGSESKSAGKVGAVDAHGSTPLHWACIHGHAAFVEYGSGLFEEPTGLSKGFTSLRIHILKPGAAKGASLLRRAVKVFKCKCGPTE